MLLGYFLSFWPYLLGIFVVIWVYLLALSESLNSLPSSIPWIDRRPGEYFSSVRACMRQHGAGFEKMKAGVEDVSLFTSITRGYPLIYKWLVRKAWNSIHFPTTKLQARHSPSLGTSGMDG